LADPVGAPGNEKKRKRVIKHAESGVKQVPANQGIQGEQIFSSGAPMQGPIPETLQTSCTTADLGGGCDGHQPEPPPSAAVPRKRRSRVAKISTGTTRKRGCRYFFVAKQLYVD
jgi:hypothetical protein